MSSQQERERRKTLLLRQIQQQRLDLTAGRRDWLTATAPLDRGWLTLQNLRSWALVGSGVMAIWSVRHPRFLMRWTRRGVGVWSTWRMVKGLLRQQSSR
ncbi:YqjK-like family protein [Raoultella terrigena]|uniref:YqjK-like family protein n=1 Tax=Raoultella terrigena TaxID=577 RepID=UPI002DB8BC58|nr:YqjK-like family protein [Raoultella terrigena]MEB8196053.1 YqjK-like family protein [Raoultella terrigena]